MKDSTYFWLGILINGGEMLWNGIKLLMKGILIGIVIAVLFVAWAHI